MQRRSRRSTCATTSARCHGPQLALQVCRAAARVALCERFGRTPMPGGELRPFTLRWEENGVPHAAHQAHVLAHLVSPHGRASTGPRLVRRALAGRTAGRDGRCRP